MNNKSAELTLELCAESDGTTIYALTLKQEEYIYCNAVDGRIIKFLPIISISEDLCIIRKKYASSELTIYQKDAESWTLDGDNVISFAAGNSSTGFLLVNNDGKINYIFYNPAKDFFVRAALDTISRPVVEAVINSKGYQLLLNDGTILSGYKFNQEAKVVSISPVGRAPFPEIEEDFNNERS